jgi:hypothetical protein|tara:strand:+ start:42 stop:257 length:216 start_codon:yes stop_codon:yes gene_type:complete
MVLFKIDNGERNREIIQSFSDISNNPVITQCFKNKLELGSCYPNKVEQQIQEILVQIDIKNAEPEWLHLLD